jgi:hypothetical protein
MIGARKMLLDQLDPLEQVVAESVASIPASRLDEARSEVRLTATKDVLCRIFSIDDLSCPFELVFHQEEARYSSFIGLGAEVSNYDEINTPELATEAANGLKEFLESTVHCELVECASNRRP